MLGLLAGCQDENKLLPKQQSIIQFLPLVAPILAGFGHGACVGGLTRHTSTSLWAGWRDTHGT